jgi:carboxyl-terminal processing protease
VKKITKIKNWIMKHYIKLIAVFIITATIVLYSLTPISYSKNDSKSPDKSNYDSFIQDIISVVRKEYVEEKTDKELAEAAANGILTSLDPHSSYLNEDALKEMHVQTKGEFGGLGIEIISEHSLIRIISAIEGTPADRVGIESGDYISKVNGSSIVNMKIEEVVKKLRGKPGTKVAITVLRKNEKAPLEFVIEREIIKIKAVRSSRENDVAYVKINSFSQQAYVGVLKELKKMIGEIGQNKIKGIVLDLRNNPGGLLDEAVKVSELFLDKGKTIVSIGGRNKDEAKIYKDDYNQTITKRIPVAVLINEGSASASEIVAGALQDNKRAIIMGLKSFGKGSVQSVMPLENGGGALKMTTALYYTPSGKSIQAHGIEPDIIVNSAKLEKNDNALDGRSEATLNGHLKNQINNEIAASKKSQIGDDNLELYNKDYQLARAIDLLRGISIYKAVSQSEK